jgi:hypothetical protein
MSFLVRAPPPHSSTHPRTLRTSVVKPQLFFPVPTFEKLWIRFRVLTSYGSKNGSGSGTTSRTKKTNLTSYGSGSKSNDSYGFGSGSGSKTLLRTVL